MLHPKQQATLFGTEAYQSSSRPAQQIMTFNELTTINQTQTQTQTQTQIQTQSLTVEELPAICHASKAHSSFRIILTGPACMVAAIILFLVIHLLHRSILATLILILPLPLLIRHDYEAFLALGPGGTPSTFLGYLKITCLRLVTLKDPFTPPILEEPITPVTGYFEHHNTTLTSRDGPRPTVAGIAPQRQLDQPGSRPAYLTLRSALENTAVRHSARARTGTSCFEKQGLALFAISPVNATCRGEICHVHHSDRSLHMNLHPKDAAVVLEKGWGQRHPLAKGGLGGGFVPRTFTLIYAPRDEQELQTVLRIIEAAAWWVTGERYEIGGA